MLPIRVRGVFVALLALALASLCSSALAQSKVKIYISATTPDQTGQTLLYKLREQLARSSVYQITGRDNDSLFQFRVVTLDPTEGNSGVSTVYSLVLTGSRLDDPSVKVYLSSWVGTCGRNRVDTCADNILGGADSSMQQTIDYLIKTMGKN